MTLDHINKFLLHDSWPLFFILGRLVFPIFGFVFAYNLARPDSLSKGRYQRASLKLLGFGLLATIPYTMLGGLVHGWWPLNVLFILLAATLCIWFVEKNNAVNYCLALLTFALGGVLSEFWWLGIAFVFGLWLFFRWNTLAGLLLALVSLVGFYDINNSHWALLFVPFIGVYKWIPFTAKRSRSLFYFYYPAHLAVILIATKFISN